MMLYSHTTFIGVDPTAGRTPFVYAALDHEGTVLALGQGESSEVLAFVGGQSAAYVAVCAPCRPNQRLMERDEFRQTIVPPPRPGRWLNYRLAEYQLRQMRIGVTPTLSDESLCPGWMRCGFAFYRHLEEMGYQAYPGGDATCQYLEVHPHACYTTLLGQAPFPKHSLEGRLQRQILLDERGVSVPDAMRFFEEVTRHRLLHGVLPLKDVYTPEELDALVAAYSAWLTATQPDQVTLLGAAEEGQLVLPVAKPKEHY